MLFLLFALAHAASWTVEAPLRPTADAQAAFEQAAGVALRVRFDPVQVSLPVHDISGAPVLAWPEGDAWVIAAPDRARTLRLVLTPRIGAWVQKSAAPNVAADWQRWEVGFADSLLAGRPILPPPWGGERARALLDLRARALADTTLPWLGMWHDLMAVRPIGSPSHAMGRERAFDHPISVRGPGTALVRLTLPEVAEQLAEGAPTQVVRFSLLPLLNDAPQPAVRLASTGSGPVSARVWIPPGEHRLDLKVLARDGAALETDISVQVARIRPTVLRPPLKLPVEQVELGAPAGVYEAETRFLAGDRAGAWLRYARAFDELSAGRSEGAQAVAALDLSRARALALAPDAQSAARFAVIPEVISLEGLEALADAALSRTDLPPEVVLAIVERARDPDLDALARWLDSLGGLRPRGYALLRAAEQAVPWGVAWGPRAVREASLSTRWTRLSADPGSLERPRYDTRGPGTARVRAVAGDVVALDMPVLPRSRYPVLRLLAAGPVVYAIDGVSRRSLGGTLDVAMRVGEHRLEVLEGELLLLDPEAVVSGGAPLYEWRTATLPARFALPEPAWPGELRVDLDPPSAVTLRFESPEGPTEVGVVPMVDGRFPNVPVPKDATGVVILGSDQAGVSLSLRTLIEGAEVSLPRVLTDEAEALLSLDALSRRIDAGDREARFERAALLAQLGQVTAARRDIARILPKDHAEGVRLRALYALIAPPVPGAPFPGPRTAEAALAEAGVLAAPPTDAEGLERLAVELDQPILWVKAGEVRLAAGDLAGAVRALQAAGDLGSDMLDQLDVRLAWSPVSQADNSAGVVMADASGLTQRDAFWRRARSAMLATPWPSDEGELLRGDTEDVAKFTGSALTLQFFCRDEAGSAPSCDVPVRVNDQTELVRLQDGVPLSRSYTLGRGAHSFTVGGPGAGRALAVRAEVDGALLEPQRRRRTLIADGEHPIVLTVAAPTLLRVRVVSGAVRLGEREVRAGQAPAWIPVLTLTPGPLTLRLVGTGEVVLDTGTLLTAPVPPTPVRAPEPEPSLPDALTLPLLGAWIPVAGVERVVPGRLGTLSGSVRYLHDLRTPPDNPWDAVELSVVGQRAARTTWGLAEGWARGPTPAAGARAEIGGAWPSGWASAELRAGGSLSRARPGYGPGADGSAGSAAIVLRAREDLPVTADNLWRTDLLLRGAWSSSRAEGSVDPRAWTQWGADHPFTATLGTSWVNQHFLDLRTELGGAVTTNSPGTAPLDSATGLLGADLLVQTRLVFTLDAQVGWRFADAHRAAGEVWSAVAVGGHYAVWLGARRLELFADVGLVQLGFETHAGVRWSFTDGRGLHDRPPGTERFRSTRERW